MSPQHIDETAAAAGINACKWSIAASVTSAKLWLQDSASVQQAAVPIMRELVQNANVFLVTHVIDDVGEATVRGALEDVGLVGTSEGQIKPHRLVFCSTLEGKVSIVRQLEPELHIDGHPSTVRSHHVHTALHTQLSVLAYLTAFVSGHPMVSRCNSICAWCHADGTGSHAGSCRVACTCTCLTHQELEIIANLLG